MRKVKRLLKENWIPIVAGILLTKWAVDYVYQMRGYDAIGSEWLAPYDMRMVYSLMYGMKITNNFLKMHGGIMVRNAARRKCRRK